MRSIRFQPVLAALWCLFCGCCLGQLSRDYEAELVSNLKSGVPNYSPLAYPKLNRTNVVYVAMNTLIGRLVSVDSAKQSVKLGTFMMATWDEDRLVWNPASYGGVRTINWDPAQIWFPVICIYNGIGDNQVLTPQMPVYLVSQDPSRTSVTATWRREFEFSCRFDMSKFPTDEHTCDLEFFFSDQGRNNIMVRPVKPSFTFDELSIYQESSEWLMLNATAIATEKQFKLVKGNPPVTLPFYILRIRIKRVSNYYVMSIIVPLLLLTLLQALLFFVPVESGEKLGFGITIMLSYTVFLLLLDGIVPKSQSTPAIGSFITAAMVLSTVSLLLTSIIMRFHFTPPGSRMPDCARAVFVCGLGRLFRVTGADRVRPEPTSEASVRKTDGGGAAVAWDEVAVTSDWLIAAYAIERLMVALGVAAIAVIIGLFIVKPYMSAWV